MRIFPFSRFIVDENSMLPAYKPGDHVLTFNWTRLEVGDAVVFKSGKINYLKRIDKIDKNTFYLFGDNKIESSKIWKIDRPQIVGRVIYKY